MAHSGRVFLSAEWRHLVMLNYEVDPALLSRYVPQGTSLDSFQGKTYVSLVGFRFCRTKLLGRFQIPFHANFEEVNLRFYVRRKEGAEDRRGVVFIAEVVPKRAIATVARVFYGENYVRWPMTHKIETDGTANSVEYQWRVKGRWCKISVKTSGLPQPALEGSLEQFITEHYWGYSKQRGGGALEYRVEMSPGKFGRRLRLGLKVTRVPCTGKSYRRFFIGLRRARLWRTGRRCLCCKGGRWKVCSRNLGFTMLACEF